MIAHYLSEVVYTIGFAECPAVMDMKEYIDLLREDLEGCALPEESEAECMQAQADYEMYLESMEGE